MNAFLAAALAGCAVQRAQTAATARTAMVGMPKEDVLACMGVPNSHGGEANTEVWSYSSGDDSVVSTSMANGFARGQSSTIGGQTTGSASSSGFGLGVSRRFSCTVNIVFREGRVTKVNYSGPTGPLLARGEQCSYAVQNCVNP